ncbi:MAG TPA: thioredoxin domain-containing protein [Acidobacteriaceae bacterium]|jgi:protein-disulfide isomerase|nr:thioredoxin domain-containing protein [Acidobacteriaceae bacterium]
MVLSAAVPVMAQAVAAQTGAPQASAPQAKVPAAPAPQKNAVKAPEATTFPAVNPKNFTATSPTVGEVNGFLKAIWGFDASRKWEVAAILKTQAPGVAKVVVLISDARQQGKTMQTVFFTTPDGKHAIADNVIDFGPTPFADARKTLQERADGPAQGAKSNDLLLVEFADLQCEHCRDAQEKMGNLAEDFPQARIVFEDYPLTASHPYSREAALDGVCVRKTKGDAAFFSYAQAVYAKQAGLTAESAEETLKAAETAAGADPAAVAACAATPEAKEAIDATIKLGEDLGVYQTPMIDVNGHLLALESIPYETLKRIVAFQAEQDGVKVHLQPTLTTLQ